MMDEFEGRHLNAEARAEACSAEAAARRYAEEGVYGDAPDDMAAEDDSLDVVLDVANLNVGMPLDYLVAKARGHFDEWGIVSPEQFAKVWCLGHLRYSSAIALTHMLSMEMGMTVGPSCGQRMWWAGICDVADDDPDGCFASTPVLAILRCYLTHAVGKQVTVPREIFAENGHG